jgi:opacity protein-like surface antigen
MKNIAIIALLATSLATSAHALIVGADVGYLLDSEEEFISARIGHEFKASASLSHQIEAEIGYSSASESGVKASILPITLNYRAETTAAKKLGYYFGGGVGLSITEGSGYGFSDDSTSFAFQAFTGLSYQASPTVKLHAGVKYLWIDDVSLFGTNIEVGDDVALTVGLSIKF